MRLFPVGAASFATLSTGGAAAGYGSERYKKSEALQKAIDALAEELTGGS